MENVVKYFDTIESSFKRTKILTVTSLVSAVIISLGSLVFAAVWVSSHSDNIYIMDNYGGVTTATLMDSEINKEFEIQDHVRRFHELMFNIYPSKESIKRNVERALTLSDKSAYDYYRDQDEKGKYSRIVQNSMFQEIIIDSTVVDMSVYPFTEVTYAKIYVTRQSNITQYDFVSTGQINEIGRSKGNPHGLLIERFNVLKYDLVETRKRK